MTKNEMNGFWRRLTNRIRGTVTSLPLCDGLRAHEGDPALLPSSGLHCDVTVFMSLSVRLFYATGHCRGIEVVVSLGGRIIPRNVPRNVPQLEANAQLPGWTGRGPCKSMLSTSADPPRAARSVICPASGCGAASRPSVYPALSARSPCRGSTITRTTSSGSATNPR
jgi:hypothetical protein